MKRNSHLPANALGRRRLLLGLLHGSLGLGAVGSPAQTPPTPAARLRWRLERAAQQLEIGEALVLSLEVWVSSWFQAPLDFPTTLEADGAMVELVGGSPDSRFEEFNGQRWTGLIRRYRLLPVQPGEIQVRLPGPLQVHPGGGAPLQLAPPAPLRLQVRVPAGAEDIQPFIAARRLEMRQHWSPSPTPALQVGDLVRREIVLITDTSSPLLAPPDFGSPVGARVHVQSPTVQEQRAHAAATAVQTQRHEGVYTLEQVGRLELPAVELVWWDLQARRRRVTRIEGLTLQVQPAVRRTDPFAPATPPAPSLDATSTDSRLPPTKALAALLALGVAATGLAWHRRARNARAGAGAEGKTDPAALWRRLRQACRRQDAARADAALTAWMLQALRPDERMAWLQNQALATAMSTLQRHRFAPTPHGGAWRGDALWSALQDLRQDARRRAQAAQADLPRLHP